jgi:catechol 2,3-dioxygenase-like lactoylglutathione lyase family enzyme
MDDRQAGLDRHTVTEAKREQAERSAHAAHPETYSGTSPIKVRKLGHLVYEVSDMERSVRFWTEVMGFEVSDTNDIGMVFLRCNDDHHGIGLKPSKKKKRAEPDAGLRVEHLALEVESTDALLKARDYLKANNIPIVFEGRKGAGCNIALNFLDPDGHEFELYCNMDKVPLGQKSRPKSLFKPRTGLEAAIADPVQKNW